MSQRRLTAAQALRSILQLAEDAEDKSDSESDEEIFGDVTIDDEENNAGGKHDESDCDIDFFVQEENESDEELEVDSTSSEQEHCFEAHANGITYRSEPFMPRSRDRNIITFRSRNLSHPQSEEESFLLFLSEEILYTIQRYTNRKVSDIRRSAPKLRSYMSPFQIDEIKACLSSILLRAGVDRDNFTALEELWNPKEGRPFFRGVMSLLRFKFFLRTVRFDNFRNRNERLKDNRLAAIYEIWTIFRSNFSRFYIPESVLTVDEQLVGYRGQAPGRTYLPSKPAKYGVKIFWLCEAQTGYALNAYIYCGKSGSEVHKNLARDVVIDLCEPVYGSHRDIVTDNFFTSHALALELLKRDLTLLGTMRLNRKEIPDHLKQKRRDVLSSEFVHDHENKIVMVSYIPKRNKNVVLLSSSHSGCEIVTSHNNKPQMILDYNFGKKGVDQFDQNIEEYTCRRKTVRWPLLLFFNMVDVAAFNAFLILKKDSYSQSRREFLKRLSLQLAWPYAVERQRRNRFLPQATRSAAALLGFISQAHRQAGSHDTCASKLGRCKMCSKVTRSSCDLCGSSVCPEHRRLMKLTKCYFC